MDRTWKVWARKMKLDLSAIPTGAFESMQKEYAATEGELEREVYRAEWASEWENGPKDTLIYGLGHRLCRRTKNGWTQEEYNAWEYFALEHAWNNGVERSCTEWSADGSQLLVVCDPERRDNGALKLRGYVSMYRIENQPIHVVRTWAVHWSKSIRRSGRIDDAITKLAEYVKSGSWEDTDERRP